MVHFRLVLGCPVGQARVDAGSISTELWRIAAILLRWQGAANKVTLILQCELFPGFSASLQKITLYANRASSTAAVPPLTRQAIQ